MKCMYQDHVGPHVGIKYVFIPQQVKDNGHAKIGGPLICVNCYQKEFGNFGFLPEDVWVETTDGPMLLADLMSIAVPSGEIDREFEERLEQLKKGPAWSAYKLARRMKHFEVEANKDIRKKHQVFGRGY